MEGNKERDKKKRERWGEEERDMKMREGWSRRRKGKKYILFIISQECARQI